MAEPGPEVVRKTREILRKNIPAESASALDYGKLPPQAVDFEEAVLGALMIEEHAINKISDILRPEFFYVDKHQRIFKAIQMLHSNRSPIDMLTVSEQLKKNNDLEAIGGYFAIAQLTNKLASAANIEYHTLILKEKYIQRQLISTSAGIIKQAYEDSVDVFDLLNEAESALFQISQDNATRETVAISHILTKELKQLDTRLSADKNKLHGITTGFRDLDSVTGGWQKTDLVIVAARPAMGKTSFTLALARNAAIDGNTPVAIFSLEMSSGQLVQRLVSMETEIKSDNIRKGILSPAEYQQLTSRIDKLRAAPIFIDDTPSISIYELRTKCRRLKHEHNVGLVIIDYLQLMTGTPAGQKAASGNRTQEIGEISRSLKGLAKELEVPVIALSQLSRQTESRGGDKRPMLSDLRDSGSIEQDADIVMFLYRAEYYGFNVDPNTQRDTKNLAEVIIAKHRNGPVTTVNTKFINDFAKFENLDDGNDRFDGFTPSPRMTTITRQSRMNQDDDFGQVKRNHGPRDFGQDDEGSDLY